MRCMDTKDFKLIAARTQDESVTHLDRAQFRRVDEADSLSVVVNDVAEVVWP